MESTVPTLCVIVPAFNESSTLPLCLNGIFNTDFTDFEVIVVDDGSSDNTVAIAKNYSVKVIALEKNLGPSLARNIGAENAIADYLLFIDADCILESDSLKKTVERLKEHTTSVVGGTYHWSAFDNGFFSHFQSVFVHFFETQSEKPDYVASHFMAMRRTLFLKNGGFKSSELFGKYSACCEDVDLSHRIKRSGHEMVVFADLSVRHIFEFNFWKSIRNAFKKSRTWSRFLLSYKGVFADSGTASIGLKISVFALAAMITLSILGLFIPKVIWLIPLIFSYSLFVNRNFLKFIYQKRGLCFFLASALYYLLPFSFTAGLGSQFGVFDFLKFKIAGDAK